MLRPGDFTAQADAYAEARPSYPDRLVDELVTAARVRAGDPVVDLGAGTGLFTVHLVRRGFRVTAVEPNAAMRERNVAPVATWTNGTFESTGLGDTSTAWVTAAQAFHWAEPERALPELQRVLRPGGAFTALWNERDPTRSEVLAWTRALIQELVPGFDEGYRDRDWAQVLRGTGHFDRVATHAVEHVVPMPCARYLALWRSHHLLNRAAGPDGIQTLLQAIEARLSEEAIVEVSYVCRAFTAFRV